MYPVVPTAHAHKLQRARRECFLHEGKVSRFTFPNVLSSHLDSGFSGLAIWNYICAFLKLSALLVSAYESVFFPPLFVTNKMSPFFILTCVLACQRSLRIV